MTSHYVQKIGLVAAHGVFALSMLMPVAALAATPPVPTAEQTTAAQGTGAATAPTATTPAGGSGATQIDGSAQNFTPLTQLPGIGSISKADNFSSFLNTLYKICIGIGAVLAVLMIMYAGVLFMTSAGSVSSNEKAKDYIKNAILGLVLVLTPTIVFGIINPSILNINIGSEFAKLTTGLETLSGSAAGTFTGADTYLWQDTTNSPADAARCKVSGGTLQQVCGVKADGSGGTDTATGGQCPTGQAMVSTCHAPANLPTTGNSCNDTYAKEQAYPIDQAPGYCVAPSVSAPHGCCSGSNPQNTLCCATPKNPPKFLLAYYFTKQNTSTKNICYVRSVGTFDTQQKCTDAITAGKKSVSVQEEANTTFSAVTVVKSCESVDAASTYTLPAPNNLPVCP